ncbi:hypothetical protein [Pteropox virus]|uniref:Uncharacterized protein n=1 Tax=Pteropox virus TaxID=1873698 RepID=A0A1B1MRH0_9POXV|nr:hypothetical protein [Pteropox virus]ANS71130.1 hypothetical protein [Pteropox virus]
MEFVLNAEVREALEQRFNTHDELTISSLCKTTLCGTLHKYSDFDVVKLVIKLSEYTTLSALYVHPSYIYAHHVVDMILNCTRIHDDCIPYVNKHVPSCVKILDHDMLIKLVQIHSTKYKTVYAERCKQREYNYFCASYAFSHPLKPFLTEAIRKGYSKYHKTFPYWLVKGIPSAVEFIHDDKLEWFLDDNFRVVTEALNYRYVPSQILLKLFKSYNILPYNHGLLEIKDPNVLCDIVFHFMKNPEIDFTSFVDHKTFCSEKVCKVIINNLCPHVSKPLIRTCLTTFYTNVELRAIIGMSYYVCVATEDEIIEMGQLETFNMLTMDDINMLLKNVYVLELMDIKDLVKTLVIQLAELAPSKIFSCAVSNPEGYLKLMENSLSEEHCAVLIRSCARKIYAVIPHSVTTPCIFEALIATNTFSIQLMEVEELANIASYPHLQKIIDSIELEDLLCIDFHYINALVSDNKLDLFRIYAEKFSEHPCYFGVVTSHKFKPVREILLNHTFAGRFPMTYLHHVMYTEAYKWCPKSMSLNTPLNITKTMHLEIQSDKNIESTLSDGSIVLVGSFVRRRAIISEVFSKSFNGGNEPTKRFKSEECYKIIIPNIQESPNHNNQYFDVWREFGHSYVNIISQADAFVGLNFHRVQVKLSAVNAINQLLLDLLTLMERGIFFKLFNTTNTDLYEHVMDCSIINIIRHDAIKLCYDSYITLDDELATITMSFKKTNLYLARVRIYAHYLLQYILYTSVLWFRYNNTTIQFDHVLKLLCITLTDGNTDIYDDDIFKLAADELYSLFNFIIPLNEEYSGTVNSTTYIDALMSKVLALSIKARLSRCK